MLKRIDEMIEYYKGSFRRYNMYKQNHPYQELVYKLYNNILSDLEELKKLREDELTKEFKEECEACETADDSPFTCLTCCKRKLIKERQAKKELEGLYFDLLNQVENKYPHESRHETAKRYIRDYHKVFNIAQEETIKHKEK